MNRLHLSVIACSVLNACFSPESVEGTDTEAGTSATESGGPTSLTSTTASTGVDTTADTAPDATGPDPDTTTTDTSDNETGSAPCTDQSDCAPGTYCIDGACGPCSDSDDGDAVCAAEVPDLPFCDPDLMQCVACTPAMCTGQTPVCDAAVGCAACTEHAHCPDSACHLMGPDQGACFDPADVVEISDVQELENELLQMGNGDQRVFRLAAETFTISGSLSLNGEVALLGEPGAVLTGGATNLMVLNAGAYLYVAGLVIEDGPFRALNGGTGAGLWIDDTSISGYPVGVAASCETHVRRSILSGPNVDAIAVTASAELFMENTAVGPGAGTALELGDVPVDLRYVTLAGNGTSLTCAANTSGEVRNSIIVGATSDSIDPGCFMMFADNAVDTFGFGDQVGAFDPAWFADSAAGDFHLSAMGEDAIGTVADWDEGDPATDIDGDPRPMGANGYPGIDEP